MVGLVLGNVLGLLGEDWAVMVHTQDPFPAPLRPQPATSHPRPRRPGVSTASAAPRARRPRLWRGDAVLLIDS